ncbi:MAG: VOC family protein, partial [Gammaproteobacteria bacterium]|nr:VOC family protein [Gammaproteobacteria bacterium]
MSVLRIGHINIRVLDMEEAVSHYSNVLGMKVVHKDAAGNIYLKAWDEWDKFSVILSQAESAGMNHIAYKVKSDADLDSYKQRIKDYGVEVEDLPPGEIEFVGRTLKFNLPSGHLMYLYAEKEFVGIDVGSTNPDPWPKDTKGCAVHWLDHALLMCELNPDEQINKVAE